MIADAADRVFTVLAGQPNDPNWAGVISRATKKFNAAQAKLSAVEAPADHRRGGHFAVHTGMSIGSGQKHVGNLKNSPHRQKIIDDLKSDPDILRIANFGSGGLRNYVPKVHDVYACNMDALLASDSTLTRNFVNNVFAAATFNLGPRVATYPHLDHLNYAFGMCAVTALGNYDPKESGHIILWDAKLIIEFPPGS
ncbi:hypothetical protein L226DRAFT_467466, partial [Lentinus tigrinus ALCF2SS1-7]|uniref:uncharacterized protein n=1 Tax=Lentinus tigrinus ALCF2SS1-7 TaxID=1328758 RepID=UPI00116637E1